MILVSQKRVVIGLTFALLCTPVTPTKAHDNSTSYAMLMGCIVGLCGLIYGIVQACKKSPEQIADDAEKTFNTTRPEGRRFYSEYMNVFMRACHVEPTLDDIESNFLEVVAYRMYAQGLDVEEHIYVVQKSIESLKKALEEVKGAVKSLQSRNRTPLYDRLVKIKHEIESELEYLKDYHQRFSEHRAYFVLAVFELKLRNAHDYEIALLQRYSADSYQLEKQLLQRARAYSACSEYPIVYYYELLRGYNATLDRYIRNLKHWYTKRVPAAKQLIECFGPICSIIADVPAFKEERELKKADDARRRMVELREREVRAQADMAAAAERQAQAAKEQAQAAKEQARAAELQALAAQQQVFLKQIELAQPKPQATVVVVNQC